MADKRTRVMINNLLKNGELYAAQQKCRTTAARLLKTPAPSSFGTTSSSSKAASSSSSSTAGSGSVALPYDEAAQSAADLLYDGARSLLEKGERGGGTDLTLYLLDVWKSRGVRCSDENRNKIKNLIALVGGGTDGSWRKSIVDHACAWSASNPETPAGDAALHAYIGEVLFKDRDYVQAENHLLAAQTRDSARTLASLLFDWYKTDPSSTTSSPSSSTTTLGRYAARGVLSYLEGSSLLCASVFLTQFLSLAINAQPHLLVEIVPLSTWPADPSTDSTSSSSSSSSSTSLSSSAPGAGTLPAELVLTKVASLNFLQLLIKSCQAGSGETSVRRAGSNPGQMNVSAPGRQAFMQLMQRYEREVPWLAREQEVKESTSEIGQMYLDMKPQGGGGANMLGDLMSSLFGGGGGGGGAGGAASAQSRGPQIAGRGRGTTAVTSGSIGPAALD